MTLQEERAALVKRIEEIDAEASFKPGWYICHDDDEDDCRLICLRDGDEKILNDMKDSWLKVEPVTAENLARFLPKPATLYDWSKAPDWAKYCATDVGGEVWWYEIKPNLWGDRAYWSVSCGKNKEEEDESVKLRPPVPWYQSLEQRPEGVSE